MSVLVDRRRRIRILERWLRAEEAALDREQGAEPEPTRNMSEAAPLIREMAAKHFGHLGSERARANAVSAAARRYMTNKAGWPKHESRVRVPDEIRGRPEEVVWLIVKGTGKFPAPGTVREMVAGRYYLDFTTG